MAELARLERWYAAQCDGDWEHEFGIRIVTVDNPGWHVSVDIGDTELEDRPFATVRVKTEIEWILCRVEGRKFLGDGGPGTPEKLIREFCDWAEGAAPT